MMIIELHTHTSEGSACGQITAKELIEAYLKTDVECIVITNHYSKNTYHRFLPNVNERYLLSYNNAKKAAKDTQLIVLFGIELNLANHPNDYLLLGINEDFLNRYPLIFDETIENVSRIVHQEGGLVIQAHPFRKPCEIIGEDILDGYEFNAGSFHNNNNDQLTQWVKDHLSTHPHLIYTHGSDCHGYDGVAIGTMEIKEKITNNQELVQALKQPHNNYWNKIYGKEK